MVPMISMVVGTVLTLTSVTETAGTAVLLLTAFLMARACVSRSASTAMITTAMAITIHVIRRGVSQEPAGCDESFSNMRVLYSETRSITRSRAPS